MVRIISKCYRLTENWGGIKGRKEFYDSKALWSRVLDEKLTGPQQVKILSAFVETRTFITSFTSATNLSLS
jgi:truncated hemoglobin YjbI